MLSPEFIPAAKSGLGARRDYILLEGDFEEYPEKTAFQLSSRREQQPRGVITS
jgi:hypothetical protein